MSLEHAAASPQPIDSTRLPAPTTVIVPGGACFDDDAWDITSLSGRPSARWLTLNFARIDPAIRDDVKHLFYVLLTVDTPLDRLERPASARRRVSPSTLRSMFSDLQPFIRWLDRQSHSTLSGLTDDDLRDYAADVAAAPVGQNAQMRRLFVVSRFWLMAPYLRPNMRLSQPFWERDGMEEVVGKSQWTAENKSIPVNPATMSALLVWSLRIVEDGAAAAPILQLHAPRGMQRSKQFACPDLPWLGTAVRDEPANARRLISAACLITVAYLTGMRSDEVLALSRGCCTPIQHTGSTSPIGYEILGQTFKSAVENGRAVPGGFQREVPWRAVKPVADAIAVMESLHGSNRLFPRTTLLQAALDRPIDPRTPAPVNVSSAFHNLIRWCNQRSIDLDRPAESIPADPDGRITPRRLRRTLAWFVYRRPAGRIALGIQYGHLHSATTDGYGSRVSVGLRDLFPMEEAFALRDSLNDAAQQMTESPGVSGPAANRYRAGIAAYQHQYAGLTLTARQAKDLLANPAMRIYDGPEQVLACCFDPSKALCRRDSTAESTSTPDLTACDSRCANIARTDQHIDRLREKVASLQAEAAVPGTPRPIEHRLKVQAEHVSQIIARHEREAT